MSSSSSNVYVSAGNNNGDARLAAMNVEHQTASGRRLKKKFSLKNVLKDDTLVSARMHATDTSAVVVVKEDSSSRNVVAATTDDYITTEDANIINNAASSCGMMEDISSNLTIMEGGSLGAAVFGIIKGTVGPAILYLPRGFQVSGWAIAIPSMLIATVLYIYNAHRLLECWTVERARDAEKAAAAQDDDDDVEGKVTATTTTTTDAAHTRVLLTYPELAKRTWGDGSILVEVAIAALQFGVCLTYLIFVPQNLIESVNVLFGWNIPKVYFLIAMVVVEIPLSWIRDIRKLTPTNVVATALIVYGLFFVLVLAIYNGMGINSGNGDGPVFIENLQALPAATENWFLFVGTSFFMMEGSITLLVPLQESVMKEDDKKQFAGMNQTVTGMIVVFYIAFSMICCAAFGDSIQTALTASLDAGMLAMSIQLAYSLAVILTFPLQAFPAMEVLKKQVLGPEPSIMNENSMESSSSSSSSTYKSYYRNRNILAALVICALGVVAYCAIDYLGHVVSILGSLFGIPLALVFPPLMHNKLVADSSSNAMKWMNKGVLVIGILAMIAASVATLLTWDDVGPEGRRR